MSMAIPALTYWSGVWATVILLMALAVTPAAAISAGRRSLTCEG